MPATYPTSPKTFTTKGAGDTVQPAFVNDPQLEVEAIESGLLTGTARLNSSALNAAALSVAGGSTLASLQVDGNSTMAGTVTAAQIISTSVLRTARSYVRAQMSSNLAVSSGGVWATLACNVEAADLLGEWDSTTFTFTAQSSGTYLVAARAIIFASSGWSLLRMLVDGIEWARVGDKEAIALDQGLAFAQTVPMAVGRTLQFQVYHLGGDATYAYGGAYTGIAIARLY